MNSNLPSVERMAQATLAAALAGRSIAGVALEYAALRAGLPSTVRAELAAELLQEWTPENIEQLAAAYDCQQFDWSDDCAGDFNEVRTPARGRIERAGFGEALAFVLALHRWHAARELAAA